jgi:hypothetical protein
MRVSKTVASSSISVSRGSLSNKQLSAFVKAFAKSVADEERQSSNKGREVSKSASLCILSGNVQQGN